MFLDFEKLLIQRQHFGRPFRTGGSKLVFRVRQHLLEMTGSWHAELECSEEAALTQTVGRGDRRSMHAFRFLITDQLSHYRLSHLYGVTL